MRNQFSLYCLAFVFLFSQPSTDSFAQQDNALPDLAPREVEILGRLEIAFPSLKRQPLVGFNPPPRIPEIPRSRVPFVAAYKQESADLPPSPLKRPIPPPVAGLNMPPPVRGEIEAGAGRYLTRIFRANIGLPVGDQYRFSGKLDYRGSNGDAPFHGNPDLKSPFDALEASAGMSAMSASLIMGFTVDGFLDDYSLFGTTSPVNSIFVTDPDRNGHGVGGSVWLKSRASSAIPLDLRLRYGSNHFETKATLAASVPTLSRLERRLDFDGKIQAHTSAGSIRADAHLSTAGLDASGALGSTVQDYNTAAGFKLTHRSNYDLRFGLRFLGFSAEGQTPAGGNRSEHYISPEVRLDIYPIQGVNVYLQNNPSLVSHSLSKLYRDNPYLIDKPRIQPSVKTVDLEAGGQIFRGDVQLTGRVGYKRLPNYLFYEDATRSGTGIYSRGQTATNYASARILHAGGGIAVSFTKAIHATFGFDVRNGRLPDEDVDIPYFASVKADGLLSFSFAQKKGLFLMTGTLMGPRYRDRSRKASEKVDTYLDLDLEASYDFTPWIGTTFRLENLLGSTLEQWDHYPQMPAIFSGSLRVRW